MVPELPRRSALRRDYATAATAVAFGAVVDDDGHHHHHHHEDSMLARRQRDAVSSSLSSSVIDPWTIKNMRQHRNKQQSVMSPAAAAATSAIALDCTSEKRLSRGERMRAHFGEMRSSPRHGDEAGVVQIVVSSDDLHRRPRDIKGRQELTALTHIYA